MFSHSQCDTNTKWVIRMKSTTHVHDVLTEFGCIVSFRNLLVVHVWVANHLVLKTSQELWVWAVQSVNEQTNADGSLTFHINFYEQFVFKLHTFILHLQIFILNKNKVSRTSLCLNSYPLEYLKKYKTS